MRNWNRSRTNGKGGMALSLILRKAFCGSCPEPDGHYNPDWRTPLNSLDKNWKCSLSPTSQNLPIWLVQSTKRKDCNLSILFASFVKSQARSWEDESEREHCRVQKLFVRDIIRDAPPRQNFARFAPRRINSSRRKKGTTKNFVYNFWKTFKDCSN